MLQSTVKVFHLIWIMSLHYLKKPSMHPNSTIEENIYKKTHIRLDRWPKPYDKVIRSRSQEHDTCSTSVVRYLIIIKNVYKHKSKMFLTDKKTKLSYSKSAVSDTQSMHETSAETCTADQWEPSRASLTYASLLPVIPKMSRYNSIT